ncbi:Aminoacyl-histidine_dipeptidase [Hexamita inflata]|uniref:Aminoacyl-histidine_dipeptidase n=1 Tax=Hexamita inflata TaxID=28002 RepID=A0ABP1GI40_9EUKA
MNGDFAFNRFSRAASHDVVYSDEQEVKSNEPITNHQTKPVRFRDAINAQLEAICRLAKFEYVGFRDAYGGWAPNPDSKLLKVTLKHYAAQMNVAPEQIKVEAIHAGLECGELITKYPQLEAVSIGPTIKHPHSDRELCEIDSVAPFYETVKNVILELAK